jgi:hypothetical protein
VRASAEQRLRELEHPAINRVAYLIDYADLDSVRFAAAKWLLELLGHKATDKAQVDGTVKIEVEYVGRELPTIIDVPHTNGHVLDNGYDT